VALEALILGGEDHDSAIGTLPISRPFAVLGTAQLWPGSGATATAATFAASTVHMSETAAIPAGALASFEVATLLASSCGHVVKARSSVSSAWW